MIDVDKGHPQYSEAMEILCLLPPSPFSVFVRDIAADLGVVTQAALKDSFEWLAQRYGVRTGNVATSRIKNKGRLAWIDRRLWEKAKQDAQAYFQTVYGPVVLPAERVPETPVPEVPEVGVIA